MVANGQGGWQRLYGDHLSPRPDLIDQCIGQREPFAGIEQNFVQAPFSQRIGCRQPQTIGGSSSLQFSQELV
jgi:hypothetical protein